MLSSDLFWMYFWLLSRLFLILQLNRGTLSLKIDQLDDDKVTENDMLGELHHQQNLTAQSTISTPNWFMLDLLIGYSIFVVMKESRFVIV